MADKFVDEIEFSDISGLGFQKYRILLEYRSKFIHIVCIYFFRIPSVRMKNMATNAFFM